MGASAATGRALVVCGQDEMARTVSAITEAAGLRAEVTPDGERALDLWRRHHFDAVVVALQLPGISAEEVCRELRRRRRVAIVVVSAGGGHRRVGALEAGADDHVDVPFHARELEARIRALVRRTVGALAARCDHAVTVPPPAGERQREE